MTKLIRIGSNLGRYIKNINHEGSQLARNRITTWKIMPNQTYTSKVYSDKSNNLTHVYEIFWTHEYDLRNNHTTSLKDAGNRQHTTPY